MKNGSSCSRLLFFTFVALKNFTPTQKTGSVIFAFEHSNPEVDPSSRTGVKKF